VLVLTSSPSPIAPAAFASIAASPFIAAAEASLDSPFSGEGVLGGDPMLLLLLLLLLALMSGGRWMVSGERPSLAGTALLLAHEVVAAAAAATAGAAWRGDRSAATPASSLSARLRRCASSVSKQSIIELTRCQCASLAALAEASVAARVAGEEERDALRLPPRRDDAADADAAAEVELDVVAAAAVAAVTVCVANDEPDAAEAPGVPGAETMCFPRQLCF
jgi:type IV secretory pathway TrbL component